MPTLVPRDHAEAVALFRATVIVALARSERDHGELAAELAKLAKRKFRPPGRRTTKQFSVATLERWHYAYLRGGLTALRPHARSDRGHASSHPSNGSCCSTSVTSGRAPRSR
jgi:putative transposase